MPDITQYSELGAPIIMALLFLWYLHKRDKQLTEKDKRFEGIITNHLTHSAEISEKLVNKIDQDIEIGKETHKLLRAKNGNK